jgi:hypothetical protein
LLLALAGVVAFIAEFGFGRRASIASWSWLVEGFASVLIAATPIAKARLLVASQVPGDVADGIAAATEMETSTDNRELSERG